MGRILTRALGTALLTWAVSFALLFALAESMAIDSSVGTLYPAAVMSFGLASVVGLFVFGSLMFRGYTHRSPAPAPGPAAPLDHGSFVKDLGVAVGWGCVASVVAYLLMRAFSPHPELALIVPGVVGVAAFLVALFRRLVDHMFPSAVMPSARALKKRPSR